MGEYEDMTGWHTVDAPAPENTRGILSFHEWALKEAERIGPSSRVKTKPCIYGMPLCRLEREKRFIRDWNA